MSDNIWIAWLYFKTKTGEYIAKDVVLAKEEYEQIKIDKDIIHRCFRNKLEGFKKELMIDPETKLPKLLRIEWKNKMGI